MAQRISAEREQSPRRYDGIDLLRFLAALSVLLFHYGFRGAAEGGYTSFQLPQITPFAQYGYLGVELFFIISGFVITMSSEGRSASAFGRSRFLRLYPAFLISMTLTAIVAFSIGGPRFDVSFTDWLANLPLFSQLLGRPFVDGVYWSLVLEVIFYGWVGLFIRLGWFQTRRPLIIAFWLVLSLVVDATSSSKMLHRLFLTDYASLFATGMILFDLTARRSVAKLSVLLGLASLMSIVGVLERASYVREVLHARLDDLVLVVILIGLHAAFLAMLYLPRLPRLAPALGMLGAVSYPLYLLHQHIGYMLLNAIGPHLPAVAAALVVTAMLIGLSAVIAIQIEPMGRLQIGRLLDLLATAPRILRQIPIRRAVLAAAIDA
ncbi:MAG: acyltransferase family protein [Hyphomicrobiales bacterium]